MTARSSCSSSPSPQPPGTPRSKGAQGVLLETDAGGRVVPCRRPQTGQSWTGEAGPQRQAVMILLRLLEAMRVQGAPAEQLLLLSPSKAAVRAVQAMNRICILDVDLQGVRNIKKTDLRPIYIFVQPPSLEVLVRWGLWGRGAGTHGVCGPGARL